MVSPFGPVLANLHTNFYVERWLDQFQFCYVLLCRQYVDDIICLFNSEPDADEFFKLRNSQHSNIIFTFEKQKEKQISIP